MVFPRMGMAKTLAAALNAYQGNNDEWKDVIRRDDGGWVIDMAKRLTGALNVYLGNEWEDVIRREDCGWVVDTDATNEVYPEYRDHAIVLTDGSGVEWSVCEECWVPRHRAWVARNFLMTTAMAKTLAAALNAYQGTNEWEDVIYRDNGGWVVDTDATNEVYPEYRGHAVVLTDGSGVEWDAREKCWVPRSPAWVPKYLLMTWGMAKTLVTALEAYREKMPDMLERRERPKKWEDVIYRDDCGWAVDEDATEIVDPDRDGDVAILTDGSAVEWDAREKCWVPRSPVWVAERLVPDPKDIRYVVIHFPEGDGKEYVGTAPTRADARDLAKWHKSLAIWREKGLVHSRCEAPPPHRDTPVEWYGVHDEYAIYRAR